jgi:hypothetical protein
MKLNFRIMGKIGFLLVIFGFFQPISCQMNGFQLATYMNAFGDPFFAVLVYLVLLSAVAGCIIGVLLLMRKNIKFSYDWTCLLVCIGCGFFVFFAFLNSAESKLQSGAYFILIGWIIAFIAQIKYNKNKGEYNLKDIFNEFTATIKRTDISGNTFCTHCGSKLPEGGKFCTNCGTKVLD